MKELVLSAVIRAIDEKLGEDIDVIDMSTANPLVEYYVVCTASNSRRVNAIKESVVEAIEKLGMKIHHTEGKNDSEWVLVDAYDIVVHIFSPDARRRFDFESLFKDLPHVNVAPFIKDA